MSSVIIKNFPEEWTIPTTRYRGSKRKILPWIWEKTKDLSFDTALDLFGGTAVVSLMLKRMGKQVTFNDYLHYNYLIGIALIENKKIKLNDDDINIILDNSDKTISNNFISETFKDYYFTNAENKWLDKTIYNISKFEQTYSGKVLKQKKALAMLALGQACMIKRPFNLFHRKNLKIRTRKVKRSFGNKTTWEMPFKVAFKRFSEEVNQVVFDNGKTNKSLWKDAFKVTQNNYDLVYLDPPYFHPHQNDTDYRELYHFLEGITQYEHWSEMIDYNSYRLHLKRNVMRWPAHSVEDLTKMYKKLIERFSDSIIVISHKSGSVVSVGTIKKILVECGKKVRMHKKRYTYALSKRNGVPKQNIEWLLIGT